MGACKNEATKKAFEKEFAKVPEIAKLARTNVVPITMKEAVKAARKVEAAHATLSKDKAKKVEKHEPYKEVTQHQRTHAHTHMRTCVRHLHAHTHR